MHNAMFNAAFKWKMPNVTYTTIYIEANIDNSP